MLGDEIVPNAPMVYDHATTIDARPADIWPWLIQLGRHRAGWYAPRRIEALLPKRWRAIRHVEPDLQNLAVGSVIPDWGGRDAVLEVVQMEAPRLLLFRDERRGVKFSWAIMLEQARPGTTIVKLRFRGGIRSTGWRRRLVVAVGGALDWITTEIMLRGLRERVRDHRTATSSEVS